MNPLSIIQMMKSGNPQQFMQQIMGNSQIMSNPMARNIINMAKNGDHKNLSIDDTKSTIYTYDDTYKTFVSSIDGEKRYLGTYNTYTTLSCSSYSHISTSYPSHFYKQK